MIRRYLDGYESFCCAAGECPDTCCGKWEIEVDEDSLFMYRELAKQHKIFGDNIDFENALIRLKNDESCSFLRQDGLCEMQKTFGEEYLCDTCGNYPRHVEEFPDTREYSISVSCPVAAKNLLERREKLSYSEVEDEAEAEVYDDFEDFDYLTYEGLLSAREDALKILWDRRIPLWERWRMLSEFAVSFQSSVDEMLTGDGTYDITPSGESGDAPGPKLVDKDDAGLMKDLFELLFELDPLDDDFLAFKSAAAKTLFKDERLSELAAEFDRAFPEWEIKCEQISVYFLFTYFCGAIYDEYFFSQCYQAFYNSCMIKLLWIYAWSVDEENFGTADMAIILYQYSRELENCNENQILLEKMLNELIA